MRRTEAESWFLAHGLPYFVDDLHALVRRRPATGRLLVVAVFFFIVFGAVAMDEQILRAWIEEPLTYPWGIRPISREMVQVSVFLATFSGLYFAVFAVTDQTYRREFFTDVLGEHALRVRVGYLRPS